MDIAYIESLINEVEPNDKKIAPGEHITLELFKKLANAKTIIRQKCFAPIESNMCTNQYSVEVECSNCNKIFIHEYTKSKLFKLMSDFKNEEAILCPLCSCQRAKAISDHRDKQIADRRQIQEQETQKYIDKYLDPNHSWKENVSQKQKKLEVIDDARCLIDDKIAEHIKSMEYHDFLKTPYWNAVSLYAKYRAEFKCSLCGSRQGLNTHHRSYEHHGYEHQYGVVGKDLIVLCGECHSKFHDIAN